MQVHRWHWRQLITKREKQIHHHYMVWLVSLNFDLFCDCPFTVQGREASFLVYTTTANGSTIDTYIFPHSVKYFLSLPSREILPWHDSGRDLPFLQASHYPIVCHHGWPRTLGPSPFPSKEMAEWLTRKTTQSVVHVSIELARTVAGLSWKVSWRPITACCAPYENPTSGS